MSEHRGPLDGVRVVELAAIGPVPFGVMLLADLGADVVRVDRIGGGGALQAWMRGLSRGRRSIAVDLKREDGRDVVLALAQQADVLVEGFRPGVAERLGVGPDDCAARNPALVYARVTGWGQGGPLAQAPGHDLDYIALAGALHPVGAGDRPPPPPLNYLADFGGGGAYLAFGVLAALLERGGSGRGQVVDVAMLDGAVSLTAFFHGLLQAGAWTARRESNVLDGAAPFYATYETADGQYVAVGALEEQFYAALLDRLGLDPAQWPQHDVGRWPRQREELARIFLTRTREEWEQHFAGSEACVAPVLSLTEAPHHPHNVARAAFVDVDGALQPAPAPRFSRTPGGVRRPPPEPGEHTDEILRELGYPPETVRDLHAGGVVA